MKMISGLHPDDAQSQAAFESKMFALLSLAKSKQRTPHNKNHNVLQIVSAVSETHSSVFWRESAWLLEWSRQSTNQYDCSRLLLKRPARACVQHDCCSSARAVTERYLTFLRQQLKYPVISASVSIVWVKEKPVWLIVMVEILMQIPKTSSAVITWGKIFWLQSCWFQDYTGNSKLHRILIMLAPSNWPVIWILQTSSFLYLLSHHIIKYGFELLKPIEMPALTSLKRSQGEENSKDSVIIISYSSIFSTH